MAGDETWGGVVICYEAILTHKVAKVLASDERESIDHSQCQPKDLRLGKSILIYVVFPFWGVVRTKLQACWKVTLSILVVFNTCKSFENANPPT